MPCRLATREAGCDDREARGRRLLSMIRALWSAVASWHCGLVCGGRCEASAEDRLRFAGSAAARRAATLSRSLVKSLQRSRLVDDGGARYIKRGEIAFRVIAGEGVLVPIKGGVGDLHSIFRMNEVGAAIWGLIGPERTIAKIAGRICEEFEVAPDQARRDVAVFVAALLDKGLIEPAPAAGGPDGLP